MSNKPASKKATSTPLTDAFGQGVGVALCAEVAGRAPEWIELIPAGPKIQGRDGRCWYLQSPAAVLSAFAANKVELPVDWEHSQYILAPEGMPAPAAGWINALEARNGAIWGRVAWTDKGRASVEAKDYRYVSPVFAFDEKTKEITALKCAGLVNRPNLQLAALNSETTEVIMDLSKLLAALGLADTASFEDALAAIAALKSSESEALNRAKAPPSLDKFVPRADYDVALNRATTAEGALAAQAKAAKDAEILALVDGAVADGKITPAAKDYHLAACRAEGGIDAFKVFVGGSPKHPAANGAGVGDKPSDGNTALNAEEKAVCLALNMSEADFIKARG